MRAASTDENALEFSTILENALLRADTITEYIDGLDDVKNSEGVCIKDDLDVITEGVSKSWAPLKATIASMVAKIKYPDWDTRYHQTQIGGKYSLRSIDRCNVADYLYKHGFYDTVTEFALTRSFEKAEPFHKSYSGKISPKECKSAFLNIVEVINEDGVDVTLLQDMLAYLMMFLKNRKEVLTSLQNSLVECVGSESKQIDLLQIADLCEFISRLGSGSSVIPVVTLHTLLEVIQPCMFPHISISQMKEHTAPDNHSKSYGDIEAFHRNGQPLIAIEVKHKIVITDSIVMTFDKKTKSDGSNIPLKFIITTANTSKKIVKNNICVDSFTSFVTNYLQQALMYEPSICVQFVKQLRESIICYKNISTEVKMVLDEYITELLVAPSP